MGFFGNLKNIFTGEDDFSDEREDMEYEDESQFEEIPPRPHRRKHEYEASYSSDSDYDAPEDRDNKIVSIHTTTKLQVVIAKPSELDEATKIADNVLDRYSVIINLERASKEVGNKIMLFLQGVAYAQEAKFKEVANNTYIIIPANVGLIDNDDILGELESNGFFF